jgi:hypothetical protein
MNAKNLTVEFEILYNRPRKQQLIRSFLMFRSLKALTLLSCLAAALFASPAMLFAQGVVKQTANIKGQGLDGPIVAENGAKLTRTKNGVSIALTMPTPLPGSYNYPPANRFQPIAPVPGTPEVFTAWAFIFNQPENCAVPFQCVPPPPGTPAPNDFTTARGGVYNFAGHPVSGGGTLNLVGHISVGESQFGGPFGLEDPFGAEIHVAIAPHGVLLPELLPDQFRTPIGNPSFWWVTRFLPIGAADVSLRAIPEPSTALLGGLAAMGLLVSRRRRS